MARKPEPAVEAERRLHAAASELFLAAVERPPEERDAFVVARAGDDAALVARVRALLAADPGSTVAFSASPVSAAREPTPAGMAGVPREVDAGDVVNGETRWRVLEEIGRGGMGRVYLAERAGGEVRQRVALKVLAPARFGSADLDRRFRAERQILADLEHPNVARLLDGGRLADGSPFLVMEHVEGEPFDVWCARRPGTTAVLDVFRKLCLAVHAAHQRLVIHRDIKPGNVLVTADGEPKLLDFGIAKLLDPASLDWTAPATELGGPMTLRYASPEQVRGEAVTTAADVYALGVLLYEALTGASPYGEELSPARLMHAICEAEPTPPSTVVRVAADRPEPGEPVPSRLPRDLDAIVLKALRKEPEARYGSAAELAADIGRFQEGLPVAARRPTLVYRAGKLVRRHRLASAALAVLVAGTVFAAVQRERQLAATQRERDKAEATLELLVDVFSSADPARAQGEAITVEQALDRGSAAARGRLAGQPLAEATLLDAVGRVYTSLGRYDRADEPLRRALALRRGLYPAGHPEIAKVESHLGQLALERGAYDEARPLLEGAVATLRAAGEPRPLAAALVALAQLEAVSGDAERAERLARQVVASERSTAGEGAEVAASQELLGSLAYARGEYGSAEERFREALTLRRRLLGDLHPATLASRNNLAVAIYPLGRTAESTRLLRQVVDGRRRVFGDAHPAVAEALNNLASNYTLEGRHAEAEPLLREAAAIADRTLAGGHVAHGVYLTNLAQAVQGQGRLAEAVDLHRRAVAAAEAVHGREHETTALAIHNLATALEDGGDVAAAEPLYREALAIYDRVLPADHQFPTFTLLKLADIALRRGDAAAARPLLERARATWTLTWGDGHWRVAAVDARLGVAAALEGDRDGFARAEAAWELLAAELGDDSPHTRDVASELAAAGERLGDAEAVARWRRRATATVE